MANSTQQLVQLPHSRPGRGVRTDMERSGCGVPENAF
jgi:hypothetical protein